MSESVLLSDAAPFFEDVGPHPEGADPVSLTNAERLTFDDIVANIRAGVEAPEPSTADGLRVPFALGVLARNEEISEADAKHRDPNRTQVPSTSPYVTKYTTNPAGGSPNVDDQGYNDYD